MNMHQPVSYYRAQFTSFPSNEVGLTLVELMVAMAISLFIVATIFSAYLSQQRTKISQDQVVEMQQNLRGAFFILQRELRMAGLDRLETAEAGIVTATRNEITYTQDIDPEGNPKVIPPIGPGDGKKIKDPPDVPGEMVRFVFQPAIDTNKDGQDDKGVAPLRRDIFNGSGLVTIADNIAALEFCYRTEKMAPSDPCTISPANGELDRIRSVTVSILARASNPDPDFSNLSQVFQAASGQQWIPPKDGYRRRLLISTILLRNMGL